MTPSRRLIHRRTALKLALSVPLLGAACARLPSDSARPSSVPHTDVNPWGVNTFLHLETETWRKRKTLELVARAGMGWIKQQFPWDDIERTGKGQFLDPAWKAPTWNKYDEIVDLAGKAGVRIIARLDRTPHWARDPGTTPTNPPRDFQDFADFVHVVVERYRGQIGHYQIWNEPNLAAEWGGRPPSARDFVRLLGGAFAAAVAADPNVLVLGAPLAATLERSDRARNELDFLQEIYDEGGGQAFHIHSANAFGLAFPPESPPDPQVLNFRRVELTHAVMEKNGDAMKPVWFNEYGWNASPPDFPANDLIWARVSEQEQADWTVKGIEFARKNWPWAGVFNIWFFQRRFAEADPAKSEYYFRMVDPDFTPRPVYWAVARAAKGR